ncbi:hypothetical protein CDL12_10374 [Handroanthus impetiginosus]|uniref:J domain-containing protein n=1 Tax=Handroanthus impetiginosus TaxID=429701 RepID=A0A2G9HHS2_9LAMI|nr:hypothetical protein CDL12_10374 [Handroanthus impetiginosus]
MGAHNQQSGQVDTKPETQRFLTAAEYFLLHHNFADCRKYALRAGDSDPTHPGPTRILTIASVLSAPNISSARHDYYYVCNLPHFESDAARIDSAFKSLVSILDPNSNPYPHSLEAYDMVMQAWTVLSDPIEKARFDDELRRVMGDCTSGIDGGTFWTMCPYCYNVYEYDKVFEECCLRCANERCRRVLHAVGIGAPPPPEVVEKGYYWCVGFMPFEIRSGNVEQRGENLWGPFGPPVGSIGKVRDHKCDSSGDGLVIDISDDEDEGIEVAETAEKMGFQGHSNVQKMKIAVEANGERMESKGGHENGFMQNPVNEVRMKRKKSVPWNSKKLMGRGFVIDKNQAQSIYGDGEEGSPNVDANGGDNLEPEFGGKMGNAFESGVEFFEGEDDVLVGLQCDFHLGNGDCEFIIADTGTL